MATSGGSFPVTFTFDPAALAGGFNGVTYDTDWMSPTVTRPGLSCNHEMGDETELEDGRVAGRCVHCADRITGRRMVGGLGLARLKTALVDALGDVDALPGLADELRRVEMMLELEEQSLEDARRLIETSKRMIAALLGREEVE